MSGVTEQAAIMAAMSRRITALERAASRGPVIKGAGDPEGVVTAAVGALYVRTDGGVDSTLYVKESGVDNTGWVAK